MIASMTAFSRVEQSCDLGTLVWEIRSINHRYLDLTLKLPEAFRQLEPKLRELLSKKLSRGKIDAILTLQPKFDSGSLNINRPLIEGLAHVTKEIQTILGKETSVDVLQLLAWPGVLSQTHLPNDAVLQDTVVSWEKGVDALIAMRLREGKSLAKVLLQKLTLLSTEVARVRANAEGMLTYYRQKWMTKIQDLKIEIDSQRLEQEIVIAAQKSDVIEELDRLQTHAVETKDIIIKGGVVGRRLDFLVQELAREANTLSAKAVDSEMISQAIEMKVLVEQCREQVQNIE